MTTKHILNIKIVSCTECETCKSEITEVCLECGSCGSCHLNPDNLPLSDAMKLKLAIRALKISIARLEEIRYQKASTKQVAFLKQVLEQLE